MADERLNPNELDQLLKQTKPASAAGGLDPSGPIGMTEVEALLKAASSPGSMPRPAQARPSASAEQATRSSFDSDLGMASGDVDYLLRQAEMALASVNNPLEAEPDGPAKPFRLQDFNGAPPSAEAATLALIRDVELDVKIELGRTQMYLDDVLRLHKGSVVALDKLAGDPVDIFVNGRLIARGEVLVLNDNFCVRIAELIAGETVS